MSLLETFYIMFESNADKAKAGYKDAEKSADDFERKIESADDQVNTSGQNMVSTFKAVGAAIAAAFAVDRIKDFILETAELTDQMGKTAKRLDIPIGDLDAWGQAVARAGGTADGFVGTLDFLNKGMADIAVKGKSRLSPFFEELGVDVLDANGKVKPLIEVMGLLNEKMSQLSAQEAAGFAEKFGMDTGTLMLMQSSRRELDDLIQRQKMLGTITKEDAETAEKFNDQWDDTKQIFRNVAAAVGTFILPAFTAILKGFEKIVTFMTAHRSLIEGAIIGIASVVLAIYYPAIMTAVRATAIWIAELLLLAAPFIAIGAAIGVAIAAFAFLYDDLMNFLKGNNSVIGELSKSWPWIGETIRAVADTIVGAFNYIMDYGQALIEFYIQLGKLIGESVMAGVRLAGDAFDWFIAKAREIIDGLVKAFPVLGVVIGAVGDGISGVFRAVGAVWDWLLAKIQTGIGWVKDAVGWVAGIIGKLPDALRAGTKTLAGATAVVATVGGAPAAAGAQPPPKAITAPDKSPEAAPAARQAPAKAAQGVQDGQAPTLRERTAQAVQQGQQRAEVAGTIQQGQQQIRMADTTPLAAHTSTAIDQSRQVSKSTDVKIEKIEIHTQATDAEGISKHVGGALENQIRQTIGHNDDGVAA